MILYIKVEDGQTVDHPVADWNLMQVFGEIPSNYEPFERTHRPVLGLYEVDDMDAQLYCRNEKGVWTDLWPTRPMNAEERKAKEAEVIAHREFIYRNYLSSVAHVFTTAYTDEDRVRCEEYKAELEALVITADEEFNFPLPPIFTRPVDAPPISNPGSTPDVIG